MVISNRIIVPQPVLLFCFWLAIIYAKQLISQIMTTTWHHEGPKQRLSKFLAFQGLGSRNSLLFKVLGILGIQGVSYFLVLQELKSSIPYPVPIGTGILFRINTFPVPIGTGISFRLDTFSDGWYMYTSSIWKSIESKWNCEWLWMSWN